MIGKEAKIVMNKKNSSSLMKARTVSLRNYISWDDEPDENYRILRRIKTPIQRIAVVKLNNGKVLIYGDGYVMFGTTEDDNMWAEALVHIPMALVQNRRRILMIGGGGGITTREVLRYRETKAVTVVDIDQVMIDLGKKLKPLVRFNRGALNNPKVQTLVQDGRSYVEQHEKKWDAIIIDIPEPSYDSLGLSRLFSREFFRLLKKRLALGGVIALACSSLSVMPEYCWSVVATLKAAGFYVLPYHFDVMKKYGEDWCFCVAATRPISLSDIKISLPTRYLSSARLKNMIHFPQKYRRKWGQRKIQTDRNRVLAHIHERH